MGDQRTWRREPKAYEMQRPATMCGSALNNRRLCSESITQLPPESRAAQIMNRESSYTVTQNEIYYYYYYHYYYYCHHHHHHHHHRHHNHHSHYVLPPLQLPPQHTTNNRILSGKTSNCPEKVLASPAKVPKLSVSVCAHVYMQECRFPVDISISIPVYAVSMHANTHTHTYVYSQPGMLRASFELSRADLP